MTVSAEKCIKQQLTRAYYYCQYIHSSHFSCHFGLFLQAFDILFYFKIKHIETSWERIYYGLTHLIMNVNFGDCFEYVNLFCHILRIYLNFIVHAHQND